MAQRTERPTILVIQARERPQAEQNRMAPFFAEAEVTPRYANVLDPNANPAPWLQHSLLTEGHRAVMILGSSDADHMADNPSQRRYNTLAMPLIERIMESDLPVFAECHGDHAMARAIGGKVVRRRDRMEGGTGKLRLTPAGEGHLLFEGQEAPEGLIPITTGHKDSVILPAFRSDIDVLATTELDPVSIWVYRRNKFGVQGHPSIQDHRVAQAAFDGVTPNSELDPYVQTYPFEDTPNSGLILVNFIRGAVSGALQAEQRAA